MPRQSCKNKKFPCVAENYERILGVQSVPEKVINADMEIDGGHHGFMTLALGRPVGDDGDTRRLFDPLNPQPQGEPKWAEMYDRANDFLISNAGILHDYNKNPSTAMIKYAADNILPAIEAEDFYKVFYYKKFWRSGIIYLTWSNADFMAWANNYFDGGFTAWTGTNKWVPQAHPDDVPFAPPVTPDSSLSDSDRGKLVKARDLINEVLND